MVKLIVKRVIVLSAASAALYALIPEKGAGRLARSAIELVKLLLILAPILELIR